MNKFKLKKNQKKSTLKCEMYSFALLLTNIFYFKIKYPNQLKEGNLRIFFLFTI